MVCGFLKRIVGVWFEFFGGNRSRIVDRWRCKSTTHARSTKINLLQIVICAVCEKTKKQTVVYDWNEIFSLSLIFLLNCK